MRINWAKNVVRASTAIAVLGIPIAAFAQESSRGGGWGELGAKQLAGGVIATLVYGLVGILLVVIGFKAFSAVLPFSVKKELEEDHNLSVGVLRSCSSSIQRCQFEVTCHLVKEEFRSVRILVHQLGALIHRLGKRALGWGEFA